MGQHRRDKKIRRLINAVDKAQQVKLVLNTDTMTRWYCMFRQPVFSGMSKYFAEGQQYTTDEGGEFLTPTKFRSETINE